MVRLFLFAIPAFIIDVEMGCDVHLRIHLSYSCLYPHLYLELSNEADVVTPRRAARTMTFHNNGGHIFHIDGIANLEKIFFIRVGESVDGRVLVVRQWAAVMAQWMNAGVVTLAELKPAFVLIKIVKLVSVCATDENNSISSINAITVYIIKHPEADQ